MSRDGLRAHVIVARNVNDALEAGLWWLKTAGGINDSRNGPVVVAPGPVITDFRQPCERVIFSANRDANPFFHLYECLWMLAGRDDAISVTPFAANMSSFAEEGRMWGAYGRRWRNWFGFDQLKEIIHLLKRDPLTRRAVLTMWSAADDLRPSYTGIGGIDGKDVPCNTQVYFDATRGSLDMTVCNRSNDIVWGAYGANAVHMSFLQEFIAGAIGKPVGSYFQMSNNFHAYLENDVVKRLIGPSDRSQREWMVRYTADDRYLSHISPEPLMFGSGDWEGFLANIEWMAASPYSTPVTGFRFLDHTVGPMMAAHKAYKAGDLTEAIRCAMLTGAADWRRAGVEWLERRQLARQQQPA